MSKGCLVTKYSTKGVPAQRVLYVEKDLQCIAWRDLVATAQQGNRRSLSITSLLKSDRRAFD
eukprot:18714-Heterococcus_DN1.PRE.1